ncbi:hypothetical protein ElyMa_005108600 [Elysia marginata]|uniref:Uncharacterized protein n=1 Tax=Elysia marginata TaxID=1093978 RepID=A0AAV4JNB1_9GAST|nr:hypothetical protein ElyMa_005108600 [Elysia marginata]
MFHWSRVPERRDQLGPGLRRLAFNFDLVSRLVSKYLGGLDSSVGSGFAPWPRGRGFETQPSTVRAPTVVVVVVVVAVVVVVEPRVSSLCFS